MLFIPHRSRHARLLATLGVLFAAASSIAEAPKPVGKVVTIKGGVTASARPLKVGGDVFSGDIVQTGASGSIKLLMIDKSVLDLGPGSSFKLSQYEHNAALDRNVAIDLDFGTMRSLVTRKLKKGSKFLIRTKSSVLAVRGTEFVVDAGRPPGGGQRVTVFEGRVGLASASAPDRDTVMLEPGRQLVSLSPVVGARELASSQVNTLSGAQLGDLMRQTRLVDTTFHRTVGLGLSEDLGRPRRGLGTIAAVGAELLPALPRADGSVTAGRRTPASRELSSPRLRPGDVAVIGTSPQPQPLPGAVIDTGFPTFTRIGTSVNVRIKVTE